MTDRRPYLEGDRIVQVCIMCSGSGRERRSGPGFDWAERCSSCDGRGRREVPRYIAMSRRKTFLGRGHPDAAANGDEKWPRFAGEVPPEIAQLVDLAMKRVGVHHRSSVVVSALLLWLEKHLPEPDLAYVTATAEEIVDVPAIAEGVGS